MELVLAWIERSTLSLYMGYIKEKKIVEKIFIKKEGGVPLMKSAIFFILVHF